MLKKCKRCNKRKRPEEFNANCRMPDGRTNICKRCNADAQLVRRNADLEEHRRRERAHYYASSKRQRQTRRASKIAKANTPKEVLAAQARSYREKFPERRKARVIVGHAIRDGKLTKQPCEGCGTAKRVHAHHEDYNKPLEVRWLCAKCHGLEHRKGA